MEESYSLRSLQLGGKGESDQQLLLEHKLAQLVTPVFSNGRVQLSLLPAHGGLCVDGGDAPLHGHNGGPAGGSDDGSLPRAGGQDPDELAGSQNFAHLGFPAKERLYVQHSSIV